MGFSADIKSALAENLDGAASWYEVYARLIDRAPDGEADRFPGVCMAPERTVRGTGEPETGECLSCRKRVDDEVHVSRSVDAADDGPFAIDAVRHEQSLAVRTRGDRIRQETSRQHGALYSGLSGSRRKRPKKCDHADDTPQANRRWALRRPARALAPRRSALISIHAADSVYRLRGTNAQRTLMVRVATGERWRTPSPG